MSTIHAKELTPEQRLANVRAWRNLCSAFKGEAEKSGLRTDDDVVNYIKTEIRPELKAKRAILQEGEYACNAR